MTLLDEMRHRAAQVALERGDADAAAVILERRRIPCPPSRRTPAEQRAVNAWVTARHELEDQRAGRATPAEVGA